MPPKGKYTIQHVPCQTDYIEDSALNRRVIAAAGMVVYIPLSKRRRKSRGFTYDPASERLTCPVGEVSVDKVRQETGILYNTPSQDLTGAATDSLVLLSALSCQDRYNLAYRGESLTK